MGAEVITAELDTDALQRGWQAFAGLQPSVHAQVEWAARTDIGWVREHNEDKFDFFLPEDPAQLALRGRLWAVADGMGGHTAGQIASEAALKTLIRSYFSPTANPDPESALRSAFAEANALIYAASRQVKEHSGMGTTLVAAVVREGTLMVAHVGDSRAYLRSANEPMRSITTDHSWVEEQVRRGTMTRAAAQQSPYRNYILRSIGVEPTVEVDVASLPLSPGDRILLCSDGISGAVLDEGIEKIIAGEGASQAALSLIDAANEAGGRDNGTALILHVRQIVDAPCSPTTKASGS